MKSALLILCVLFYSQAFAKFYKFHELKLKDYEQMREMVSPFIEKFDEINSSEEESEAGEQEAIDALREALWLILSRPDDGGTDGNLVSKLNEDLGIEKNLKLYNAYWDSLHGIVGEAIHFVQKEDMKIDHRATNIYVLLNIMSQTRPYIKDDPEVRSLFIKIKDADIEIPKEIKSNFRKRMQAIPDSPSEIAERVLKENPTEEELKKRSNSRSLWEIIKGWFS